ncbi:hypothetical protein B4U79_18926 [Dinothrombium tinctorium]|uniref:HORMA domain-containing protein n=1 Tax=Dinothrombium tinctorium TaxID=1965070 RepID=A0A443RRC2_9ACAR|nr:hypothetical protein B4U79_18926 [Dinothrombium tinctorium]
MNRFSNESDAKNQDEELQKYVSSKEESIRLISRLTATVIGIYEDLDKPNEFLETYEFHYTYHETKSKLETSDCGPATHARSQIEDLLEKVFSNCRTMKPLPNNWYFTIIIFYCENSKPQEYQPEFFKAGTYPVRECYHKTNIELGRVDTPYHSIKIEFDSVKESEK